MNVADWLYALPTGIFSGCDKLENANLPDNEQGCYGIAYNAFEGTAVRDIFARSNAEINMDYFIKPAFKTGVGNVYNYAYDMTFCRAAALAAAMANQIEYSNDMSSEEVMDKIKSAVTGSANASELKDKLIFGWNNSYTDKADMVNGTLTISNADGTFVPVSFTRNKDQGLTALNVGYELSPEFSTDVKEYSVSVPNSVTVLGISAKTVPGAVVEEIPHLTGCYLDSSRGTLKLPDISPEEYSSSLFPDGVYHLYDYQFFFRNLQENVGKRVDAWFKQQR